MPLAKKGNRFIFSIETNKDTYAHDHGTMDVFLRRYHGNNDVVLSPVTPLVKAGSMQPHGRPPDYPNFLSALLFTTLTPSTPNAIPQIGLVLTRAAMMAGAWSGVRMMA